MGVHQKELGPGALFHAGTCSYCVCDCHMTWYIPLKKNGAEGSFSPKQLSPTWKCGCTSNAKKEFVLARKQLSLCGRFASSGPHAAPQSLPVVPAAQWSRAETVAITTIPVGSNANGRCLELILATGCSPCWRC